MQLVISGAVYEYFVVLRPHAEKDQFTILKNNQPVVTLTDEKFSAFVDKAKDLRIGYVEMEDGAEIVYFYDRGQGCLGFSYNLQTKISEWGYAPFYPGAKITMGEIVVKQEEQE